MKTKYQIIRVRDDNSAAEHLSKMTDDGWTNTRHFFENNMHILVFYKLEGLEKVTTYTQLEFAEN